MIKIKTNKIAGGGISAALCVVMLFLASYVPNLKLAFLFASSIIMGVCLLRYRFTCALGCYIASGAISLIVAPNKFVALMFIVLFGNYPIVKLYIERIKNITVEYIVKFIAANVYILFMYVVLMALGEQALFEFNTFVLYICAIVLLLFYDLLLVFFINAFYRTYYKYLK